MSEVFIAFPEGAAVCAPGDYLVCRDPSGGWRVYRVEDLLLVRRLVPLLNEPSTLAVEEHLLDSMAPAYSGEVQLLLTAYDPGFAGEPEAREAVRRRTLAERASGLLRPAAGFAAADCRVLRGAEAP